jgi:hypothetical protein
MTQNSAVKRTQIAHARFIEGYSFKRISTEIEGVTSQYAQMFCRRLKTSNPNASPQELVEIAGKTKPRGLTTRVQPGSTASIQIREAVRGWGSEQSQVKTANQVLQKTRDLTVR